MNRIDITLNGIIGIFALSPIVYYLGYDTNHEVFSLIAGAFSGCICGIIVNAKQYISFKRLMLALFSSVILVAAISSLPHRLSAIPEDMSCGYGYPILWHMKIHKFYSLKPTVFSDEVCYINLMADFLITLIFVYIIIVIFGSLKRWRLNKTASADGAASAATRR
jgi:hypothetical protein